MAENERNFDLISEKDFMEKMEKLFPTNDFLFSLQAQLLVINLTQNAALEKQVSTLPEEDIIEIFI